jgi:hypothetical protein
VDVLDDLLSVPLVFLCASSVWTDATRSSFPSADLDRGGSAQTGWPEAMNDREILTPLPRSMDEYELDGYSVHPERSLSDLFSTTAAPPSRPDGIGSVLLQAVGT